MIAGVIAIQPTLAAAEVEKSKLAEESIIVELRQITGFEFHKEPTGYLVFPKGQCPCCFVAGGK